MRLQLGEPIYQKEYLLIVDGKIITVLCVMILKFYLYKMFVGINIIFKINHL